jgi:hypothetical protein
MFIPDPIISIPDLGSRILNPGYRVDKIPDPGSGSASKNLSIFDPTQL